MNMKRISKLLFVLIVFIINIIVVKADSDKNLVNIYLFHSDTCPHCKDEINFLNSIKDDYDNVKIYMYEISDSENIRLMDEVANLYDTSVSGTPFTIIGDKYFKGFSHEAYADRFTAAIDYYSDNAYQDRVGEYIGNIKLPSYKLDNNDSDKSDNKTVDDYIEEKTNRKITIFGKEINLKNMTLPIISVIIGLVDGFNPCAMWVLLFLISILMRI